MASSDHDILTSAGPIVFAYDGSELGAFAIAHAAGLLDKSREAYVVCVWHPVDVGFTPVEPQHFDADRADEVGRAAEATAKHGAALAEKEGFRAEGVAIESSPAWQAILTFAEERNAGIIVLGSVRRHAVTRHLVGSVAAAVVAHSPIPVLILNQK